MVDSGNKRMRLFLTVEFNYTKELKYKSERESERVYGYNVNDKRWYIYPVVIYDSGLYRYNLEKMGERTKVFLVV